MFRTVIVCLTAGAALAQVPARGQTQVLVPWNALWKYSISDGDPEANWKNVDFNDDAWLEGHAPLGFPANESMPSPPFPSGLTIATLFPSTTVFAANPNPTQTTTYYRTRFTFSGAGTMTGLVLTNVCDDGAVIYLNGEEIARLRVPQGIVSITTPATIGNEMIDRPGGDRILISGARVNPGENVLAVEVHQFGPAVSADLCQITTLVATPAFGPINENLDLPADTSVVQGRSVTLQSSFSGWPDVTYQWFFDRGTGAEPLLQATNASHVIRAMTEADAGDYFVRATDFDGTTSVDSRTARVSHVPDLDPPTVRVVSWLDDRSILVQFDEALTMDPYGAIDPFAYSLQPLGGPPWPPFSVLPTNNNTAVIVGDFRQGATLRTREPHGYYTLLVYSGFVSDAFGNFIEVDTLIPVADELLLLTLDKDWYYNETGIDLGPAWFTTPVDTSAPGWQSGPGVLGQETAGPVVPLIRTDLTPPGEGGPGRVYFVTRFFVPGSLRDVFELKLEYYLDDGAIVYLNGAEVHRQRMDAVQPVGSAELEGPFTITGFVSGLNELAVEVHQWGSPDHDIVWGGQLTALVAPSQPLGYVTRQPHDIAAVQGGSVTFYVEAYGILHYQWQHNEISMPGETNTWLTLKELTPSDAGRYRVIVSSPVGSEVTRSAVLTVHETNFHTISLVPIDAVQTWRYDQSNLFPGPNWASVEFDDSNWMSGAALLAVETAPVQFPIRTPLSLTAGPSQIPITTYYFRTHFHLPADLSEPELLLTPLVDDGAAFYLNGTEIFRLRLPDRAPLANSDTATHRVGDAASEGPFYLGRRAELQPGDNVLAVEVHQAHPPDSDITMGVQLDALARHQQPSLTIRRLPDGNVELSWPSGPWILFQSTTPTGIYTAGPGAPSSPVILPPTGPGGFFQLRTSP